MDEGGQVPRVNAPSHCYSLCWVFTQWIVYFFCPGNTTLLKTLLPFRLLRSSPLISQLLLSPSDSNMRFSSFLGAALLPFAATVGGIEFNPDDEGMWYIKNPTKVSNGFPVQLQRTTGSMAMLLEIVLG
jgi:hypothetical protein